MKKKIICFALVLVMVCGVFLTGCSKNKDETVKADTEESSRQAATISFWMPTDASTTEEAKELVSAAINKLTQAKYNTAVEFHFIPRDEYQETIDEKLEDVVIARIEAEEAEEAERLLQKGNKNNTPAETPAKDDTAKEVGAYPSVADDQLDIFFVSGYDKYVEYIDADYISLLDGELNGNSKLLKQYIYPTFLTLANEFGVYAVPNNHPATGISYLMVNKELVEKYDWDPDNFTTLIRCKNFILDIGNQHLDGVVPLLGNADSSGMIFWGPDGFSDEWSVISTQYSDESTYNTRLDPTSTINNAAYTNLLSMTKQLDELGYIGDGTLKEGEKFAVGIIECSLDELQDYEDEYYIRVHQSPIFTDEDVFGAMFAVSTYTKNLSRSMEILTYLNTDKDIRTILQYGVEGIHWDYEDDSEETIKIISDEWSMVLEETGNVYYTYPGEGIPMDYWENAKALNLSSVSSPYCKFKGYTTDGNKEALERLAEYSKEIKQRIDECPYEEFSQLVKDLKREIAQNEDLKAMLDSENDDSLVKIYGEWFTDTYPEM